MGWKVRCRVCGSKRVIRISFDISKQPAIFYYCNVCRKDTFNDILEYVDEG